MQYNPPYGVSDPNAPYINGNPSTGTMGSIPPAASIEYPQREIVNFISDEIARLKSKVGEITMDNELLYTKIAAMEGKRPLAHRRSRR